MKRILMLFLLMLGSLVAVVGIGCYKTGEFLAKAAIVIQQVVEPYYKDKK